MSRSSVLLVAGEASGDLHGAMLVAALRRLAPDIEVAGVGGTRLRAAGMKILVDTASVATMGFVEVVGSAGRLLSMYRRLVRFMREQRPSLVILIDYPEFNLLLAKRARAFGIPVFYYIAPQVWAWRRGRVRKIAGRVDRLAVVFPFEPEVYGTTASATDGEPRPLAQFVGHPLLDLVQPTRTREQTRRRYDLDSNRPLLAILPGSRRKEIRHLLRPAVEAALKLRDEGWQAAVALASTLTTADLREALGEDVPFPVAEDDTYNLVHAADAVLVTSGTATMETALLQRPMAIMYRTSRLTYAIARRLVEVDYIGMPNIILGRGVFPELIQDAVTADRLAAAVREVYAHREQLAGPLADLRGRMGEPGAAERAARMALELMHERA
jgi:lipid-A-disaccharide synthase